MRARSRSTCCSIRASRCPNLIACGLIAERLILEVPEVKSVGRRTGRAELDEHAEGVHSSEIEVDLKPSDRSKAAIIDDLRERLAVLPVAINIGQPISHRLDHMLSGVRAQIALKIFGDDLNSLRTTAERLRLRLVNIPGLVDLQVEKQVRIPQLEIRVDYRRAGLYGVQPAAVVDQISRLSNGRVISRVVDGYRRFDVTMRLPDRLRTTQKLGDLLIETPVGWIPARQIAEIRETDGPNQILRENGRRRLVVLANTDGRSDMAKVVAAIRQELASTKLPEGFFTQLEGTFQAQEEATRTIGALSVLSLVMIFAILYSRYRSSILAFIIMGNIPLALIGSVAALWIAGQPLSVASMIGFITLAGIAARNGILKISHYINLALHEKTTVRSRIDRPRQPRSADPRFYDRALSGVGPVAAAHRCCGTGQRDPASGRRHDFRRSDQCDSSGHPAHAVAVPAVRGEAARTSTDPPHSCRQQRTRRPG